MYGSAFSTCLILKHFHVVYNKNAQNKAAKINFKMQSSSFQMMIIGTLRDLGPPRVGGFLTED